MSSLKYGKKVSFSLILDASLEKALSVPSKVDSFEGICQSIEDGLLSNSSSECIKEEVAVYSCIDC